MKIDAANPNARIELLGGGKVTYKVNTQKQLVIKPPAHRSLPQALVRITHTARQAVCDTELLSGGVRLPAYAGSNVFAFPTALAASGA